MLSGSPSVLLSENMQPQSGLLTAEPGKVFG